MLAKLRELNDRAAIGLSKVYGNPLMIWASIAFSLVGAFVSDEILSKMLYWSNSAQLVFCFVSVYVSALLLVRSHASAKKQAELAQKHDDLHAKVDEIHARIKGQDDTGGV